MSNPEAASSIYKALTTERDTFVEEAHRSAQVTIPAIRPNTDDVCTEMMCLLGGASVHIQQILGLPRRRIERNVLPSTPLEIHAPFPRIRGELTQEGFVSGPSSR